MAIEKILIFNRGEIACRVIRTAKALGYLSVAVYAEDEGSPLHADLANEAVLIGPDRRSYLEPEAAVAAARRTGSDALHPGYGFLSESAALARACQEAGVTFIGPPPEAIEAMGDKASARRLMEAAGLPCVPGYHGAAQDDATLRTEAQRIGWPLMVKAAAGGGGKGMRLVERPEELDAALRAARSEALSAFGSDALILERALRNVRHVEVQVFADAHGGTIHLGERDCSVQRRHQKVIEETPSPAVDAALREAMGATAVRAAQAVGYRGAGTVEFLLESDGRFHFLEMNTRLQVEHPVTEAVTGVDIVAWQIQVAAGGRLPLTQSEISLQGAAIEARLYAETPDLEFLPRTGTVAALHLPEAPGVRIDHALRPGLQVTPHYDPLLAKVVAHGVDREEARRRLLRALENLFVAGVETNRTFLTNVLRNPAFAEGRATTAFIEEERTQLAPHPATEADFALANLVFDIAQHDGAAGPLRARRRLSAGDEIQPIATEPHEIAGWRMSFDSGARHSLAVHDLTANRVRYVLDGVHRSAYLAWRDGRLQISFPDRDLVFRAVSSVAAEAVAAAEHATSPMACRVVSIHVEVGDQVSEGDLIAVVEAMKMEHEIQAPRAGEISSVLAQPGQDIPEGFLLAEITA